ATPSSRSLIVNESPERELSYALDCFGVRCRAIRRDGRRPGGQCWPVLQPVRRCRHGLGRSWRGPFLALSVPRRNALAPPVNGDASPDRFHHTKRPSSLQKAVG